MEILYWILLFLAVSGILMTFLVSFIIYKTLLTRDKDEKWGRSASMSDDEKYNRLFAQAEEWYNTYAPYRKTVDITNDGLHLWGEYFDFGGDKAVIVIPGRMEACVYSCHYSEPYRAAGWNVLVIDSRAHGRSDGRVSSVGYKEYRDLLAWAKLLKEEFGIKKVILHGICIGSSTAVFAATDREQPELIDGMVADGMYYRFYESFKLHMVHQKRPHFPFLIETMLFIRLISGADVIFDGPGKRIVNMKKPILFIHSREDLFSLPERAQQLFDLCPSAQKHLVWFPEGEHSKLRIQDAEAYDRAVCEFLAAAEF